MWDFWALPSSNKELMGSQGSFLHTIHLIIHSSVDILQNYHWFTSQNWVPFNDPWIWQEICHLWVVVVVRSRTGNPYWEPSHQHKHQFPLLLMVLKSGDHHRKDVWNISIYIIYIYVIYKALQIIGLKYQPQLASKFSDPSTVWSLKNKTISSPGRNISAWFFRFLNGSFKRPFGSFMIFCDFKWGRSEPLETLSHGVPCSPPPKRFED